MRNKSILVVDDEESIRLTLEHQLTGNGFKVDTAESREEAIKKLDLNSSYDLVITDLRMYGETGVDVMIKVQETNISIPVMIITGFGSESPLFKKAMELKPCGHAFKPFSKEELLEKVSICLDCAHRNN
jgi:DNA-binding NtrC family response regulator